MCKLPHGQSRKYPLVENSHASIFTIMEPDCMALDGIDGISEQSRLNTMRCHSLLFSFGTILSMS